MLLKQAGFTLIELSIVLIIIGLLVGGVLKAQRLIENAQIRSDIKQLKGFKIISLLYKDKLSKLPGEDPNHLGRIKTVLSTDLTPIDGYFYDIYHAGLAKNISPRPAIGLAFKATWGGSSGENYGLIAGVNQLCITEVDITLAEVIERQLDDGERYEGDVEYTLNGSHLCMKI